MTVCRRPAAHGRAGLLGSAWVDRYCHREPDARRPERDQPEPEISGSGAEPNCTVRPLDQLHGCALTLRQCGRVTGVLPGLAGGRFRGLMGTHHLGRRAGQPRASAEQLSSSPARAGKGGGTCSCT
jgi:hypothetical protein